ncbi:NitT/TauT family transport system permease protein [Rhizobiales bacterium GAS191]|nr:NitT/TauT family transport system permease protein [Rhizobiales bacterium GAS191]
MRRIDPLALVCGLAALIAFGLLGFAHAGLGLGLVLLVANALASLRGSAHVVRASLTLAGTALASAYLITSLDGMAGQGTLAISAALVAVWLGAWQLVDFVIAATPPRGAMRVICNLGVPVIFGATLLFLWECVTRAFGVPPVILPPPSAIALRFAGSLPTLGVDFLQTLRGVAAGYVIGSGAGLLVAILIDRVPFLQRGLLPLGNLVSALPIVGVAPIMVMWFGFDWPSKAAVVVIMTFFPMLVNANAGLAAAGATESDLMKTYAAGYGQTLLKLRLPAALPFIFNGLKINSTLALIGAIVAEFFGTPIIGMGFRINAEVGRMNIDMVWATILVAALFGSAFYGLIALIERRATFWHPSYRQRA